MLQQLIYFSNSHKDAVSANTFCTFPSIFYICDFKRNCQCESQSPSPSLLYTSIVASMRSISVFTIDISRPIPLYTLRTSVFYPYFFHASIIHDSPYLYNHFFSFVNCFIFPKTKKELRFLSTPSFHYIFC